MFTKVMQLIYSASRGIPFSHDPAFVQEALLDNLQGRDHSDLASNFILSPAWNLLYLRIRCEHGWPGSHVEAAVLANIDESLQEQFLPIFEES